MTRSLVEREVISDHLVKEITIEYLMARGEQPYRILRGGYSLWETHVPAMRLALVAAITREQMMLDEINRLRKNGVRE